MAIKFHRRQTRQSHRLIWFFKSGALLVVRPRSLRQPRAPRLANCYLAQEDADRLLRQRALYAAQNGDCAFALKGFNHLIKHNPHSAADYNNRGLVYFQLGHLTEALADYSVAIRLDPNLANVYNNRANYYAALGEMMRAIEDYDQAIRIDPMNVRAWINQGITFREMELYEQAIENFSYALDINQHNDDVTSQKMLNGHILAERGHAHHLVGDWNCAIADYYRAHDILADQEIYTEIGPSFHLQQQLKAWLNELTQASISDNMSRDLDGL